MSVEILGFGHHVPDRIVTNQELEKQLGLEEGWIERRTGIRERRWANPDDTLSNLATKAANNALSNTNIAKSDINLLILATSTPDHLLPPSAPRVAHKLGLNRAGGIDLAGACTGFLYALVLADAFVRTQQQTVLVIAANILSRRINVQDRASAILFADAAGAVVLAPSERQNTGLKGSDLRTDGSSYDLIKIEDGGSTKPFSHNTDITKTLMEINDGKAVFTKAVNLMTECATTALARSNLAIDDIDHIIPHQANARIIEATRTKLAIPANKIRSTVANYANSSAATIPLTLSIANQNGGLKPGQNILMTAAGAGLLGGAVVWGL